MICRSLRWFHHCSKTLFLLLWSVMFSAELDKLMMIARRMVLDSRPMNEDARLSSLADHLAALERYISSCLITDVQYS